jgi:hypothetical protein
MKTKIKLDIINNSQFFDCVAKRFLLDYQKKDNISDKENFEVWLGCFKKEFEKYYFDDFYKMFDKLKIGIKC